MSHSFYCKHVWSFIFSFRVYYILKLNIVVLYSWKCDVRTAPRTIQAERTGQVGWRLKKKSQPYFFLLYYRPSLELLRRLLILSIYCKHVHDKLVNFIVSSRNQLQTSACIQSFQNSLYKNITLSIAADTG